MKLSFSTTINGHKQKAQAGSNQTLLEFLRDDLKLKERLKTAASAYAAPARC